MLVGQLWRYPVKSLAGEQLQAATITADGMPGDRLVDVRGPEGVRTSRIHPTLLGFMPRWAPRDRVDRRPCVG